MLENYFVVFFFFFSFLIPCLCYFFISESTSLVEVFFRLPDFGVLEKDSAWST